MESTSVADALLADAAWAEEETRGAPVAGSTRRPSGTPAACGRSGIGPATGVGPRGSWRSVMTTVAVDPTRVALKAIDVGVRAARSHPTQSATACSPRPWSGCRSRSRVSIESAASVVAPRFARMPPANRRLTARARRIRPRNGPVSREFCRFWPVSVFESQNPSRSSEPERREPQRLLGFSEWS